jgi:hypothetical protein
MKKTYALMNLIVVVALIAWNYGANAIGINGNTIGSLSDEYNSLFTPAGYAFSIWGLIFLGLIAHSIYQLRVVFSPGGEDAFVTRMGPWLIIANLGNAAWVFFWLKEFTGISVVMMLIILLSLIIIIRKLNMEREDSPFGTIAWVWWPLGIYTGWIAVATIANVAAYLSKTGWEFLFTGTTWTVIMIIVATLLNMAMVRIRSMRDFALVGVWALLAIALRHQGNLPELFWTALICASLLFLTVIAHWYRSRWGCPLVRRRQQKK